VQIYPKLHDEGQATKKKRDEFRLGINPWDHICFFHLLLALEKHATFHKSLPVL
jgi:hypothetical protein